MIKLNSIKSKYYGLTEYGKALDIQYQCFAEVEKNPESVFILGFEHPAVITLGRRAEIDTDIPLGETFVRKQGIDIIKTDRGGQATLHNPKQLVIYPIFNLENFNKNIKDYVTHLQLLTTRLLVELNVPAVCQPGDNPGVYIENAKLASIGLRVRNHVTMHGLAINIDNDLSQFQYLSPCGLANRQVVKLSDYHSISCEKFFFLWQENFRLFFSPQHSEKCVSI